MKDIAVGDAVNLGGTHAAQRIDQGIQHEPWFLAGVNPYDGNLDDAIDSGKHSGGFEIEDRNRGLGQSLVHNTGSNRYRISSPRRCHPASRWAIRKAGRCLSRLVASHSRSVRVGMRWVS